MPGRIRIEMLDIALQDLADSVVETGRHILRKCIGIIESHANSKVIYGDTGRAG